MESQTSQRRWRPWALGAVAAVIGGILGISLISQVLAGPGGHGGRHWHHDGHWGHSDGESWEERRAKLEELRAQKQAEAEEFAALLGTDLEGLTEALRDGQSLAEIAESNGVDPQVVIDHLIAQTDGKIAAALEAGKITEEQAETLRERSAERITNYVNGEYVRQKRGFFKRGRGYHHHWRHYDSDDGGSDADAAGGTSSSSLSF